MNPENNKFSFVVRASARKSRPVQMALITNASEERLLTTCDYPGRPIDISLFHTELQ